MRTLIVLLALSCCAMLLASPVAAATTVQALPSQVVTVSATPAPTQPGFDPYVGKGDLTTKAIPVAGCYLWDFVCEEMPAGVGCSPNNPYCKCNGFGACVNVPPGG